MSKRFSLRIFTLLAMCSLAVSPLGCKSEGPGSGDEQPVNDNVKVQLLNYDGLQALLKSHVGKVVVVDVWSTT